MIRTVVPWLLLMLPIGSAWARQDLSYPPFSGAHSDGSDFSYWLFYHDKPDAWFESNEAIRIADHLLSYQLLNGGWCKQIDMVSAPYQPGRRSAAKREPSSVLYKLAPRGFVRSVLTVTGKAGRTASRQSFPTPKPMSGLASTRLAPVAPSFPTMTGASGTPLRRSAQSGATATAGTPTSQTGYSRSWAIPAAVRKQ